MRGRPLHRQSRGLMLVLLTGPLVVGLAAGTASAGRGTISASCNTNVPYFQAYGPHAFIHSTDLVPVGGVEHQRVLTRKWLYNYETGTWVGSPYQQYIASSNPDEQQVEVGGPDFNLGAGWYAAYLQAWVGVDGAWRGPTLSTWVRFSDGSWWCHGL
jgi:hypothetical protein